MFNRFYSREKRLSLLACFFIACTAYAQQSRLQSFEVEGRKVHVYLPPNYEEKKSFPVLYLLDGQNLFDENLAYAGEWRVDETLDEIYQEKGRGFIAVGIENGKQDRIAEYTEVVHSKYGGGQAESHAKFLLDFVIPIVQNTFKTDNRAKNNLIGGSSLGGIMALYLGLNHPQYFQNILSFSPSIWFYEKEVSQIYHLSKSNQKQRFFIETGSLEGEEMTNIVEPLKDVLIDQGISKKHIHAQIIQDQNHNEAFWASEFKKSIIFLFDL